MSLTALSRILAELPQVIHENLLVGTNNADDAAVYKLRDDLAIIQTIDIFTPLVDDPYTFGQIAAANALSDVYAMGGKPLTALNFIGYPQKKLQLDTIIEILKGGADKAQEAGALIVGGHSIMDPELKYGLSVTGVAHPDDIVTNSGARIGDKLILTKAIGTGVLSTAIKAGKADSTVEKAVCESMTALNSVPARLMKKFNTSACTDITGYGLLGHAYEMAAGSKVRLRIYYHSVPLIAGVMEFCKKGFIPGGTYTNKEYLDEKITWDAMIGKEQQIILCDAQTSGGLLIAVPEKHAENFLARLHEETIHTAALIGEVIQGESGTIEIIQ